MNDGWACLDLNAFWMLDTIKEALTLPCRSSEEAPGGMAVLDLLYDQRSDEQADDEGHWSSPFAWRSFMICATTFLVSVKSVMSARICVNASVMSVPDPVAVEAGSTLEPVEKVSVYAAVLGTSVWP